MYITQHSFLPKLKLTTPCAYIPTSILSLKFHLGLGTTLRYQWRVFIM
jgi:hypothetical protein